MRIDPLAYLGQELDSLKEQKLFRQLRILEDEQKAHTTVDHTSVVNLSSNNYLGLTTHPKLREKALKAIEDYGVGTGSVRTIAGTMDIHMELETTARRVQEGREGRRLPERLRGERRHRLGRSSRKEDVVISDELNHASIIDGCRLSRATIKVFPHKDVDAARKIIKDLPAGPAQAAHHRRRLQHGRRPRPAARPLRAGRGNRLHHDGGRRPCERGVRQERPRHHRSLRHARPRGHPGRDAVEGDRRPRRLRRRQREPDRFPLPPRAAVPVFDVASARRSSWPAWRRWTF